MKLEQQYGAIPTIIANNGTTVIHFQEINNNANGIADAKLFHLLLALLHHIETTKLHMRSLKYAALSLQILMAVRE